MTGRELILYILANHLEDEPVFKDGKFIGFVTVDEFAAKADVGPETVKAWAQLGLMTHFKIGEEIYIPVSSITV